MRVRFAIVAGLAAITLSACAATTKQTPLPSIVESGFLTDYSLLAPGKGDEAQLIYRNPKADLSKYDKLIFDRVHVWRTHEDGLDDLEEEELQRLADDLYHAIRSRLEDNYTFVEEPEESAIELHMALTDVKKSDVPLDVFSTSAPAERLISDTQALSAGTLAFVSAALVELEIDNSDSGDVLVAAVDRRLWRKSMKGGVDSWVHLYAAFEAWADRIDTRLGEVRAGKR